MKFSALTTVAALTGLSSAAAFAPTSFSGRQQSASALDMARKPFISGNWKLNPKTKEEAVTLAKDIAGSITKDSPDSDVALFVPYVFIEAAREAAGDSGLKIGAEVSSLFR